MVRTVDLERLIPDGHSNLSKYSNASGTPQSVNGSTEIKQILYSKQSVNGSTEIKQILYSK